VLFERFGCLKLGHTEFTLKRYGDIHFLGWIFSLKWYLKSYKTYKIMTSNVDTSLVTFKAISNFTTSLAEVFPKQRSLKLYAHLIGKTTLAHDKAIKKHIDAFTSFCVSNRSALEEKNHINIQNAKIVYSERVFIDIDGIFAEADTETMDVIWNHLLTISALVDPTGKARQILKENTVSGDSTSEAKFLENIIGKVEEHVDPNANPMEAVSSIMQSGVFTELVGGMGNGLQDGSLDLGKLMGTVQSMVTTLGNEQGGVGESKEGNPMEMLSGMMGALNEGSGSDGDMSSLVSMMGPMLETMSNKQNY
tara:strand:- start:1729 stop:2649 length:921 start_codon:yes stop_codon:yes gene_type:complete